MESPTHADIPKRALLIVLWAMVVLPLWFMVPRYYMRLRLLGRLAVDDWLLLFAWATALASTALWQSKSTLLYLAIRTNSVRPVTLPPDFESQMQTYLRCILAAHFMTYTSLWSVKLAFLMFFRGLNRNLKKQKILWWTVLVFVITTYIACVCTIDYECLLGTAKGAEENCNSVKTVVQGTITVAIFTALDVSTDICLILVPTNLLWKIQMNWRRKLAVFGLCSYTFIIIAMAIIRIVVATKHGGLDISWIIVWSAAECAAAIIIACLASFRELYSRSPSATRHSNPSSGRAYRWDNEIDPLQMGTFSRITSSGRPRRNDRSHVRSYAELEDDALAIATPTGIVTRHEFSVESTPAPLVTNTTTSRSM